MGSIGSAEGEPALPLLADLPGTSVPQAPEDAPFTQEETQRVMNLIHSLRRVDSFRGITTSELCNRGDHHLMRVSLLYPLDRF